MSTSEPHSELRGLEWRLKTTRLRLQQLLSVTREWHNLLLEWEDARSRCYHFTTGAAIQKVWFRSHGSEVKQSFET